MIQHIHASHLPRSMHERGLCRHAVCLFVTFVYCVEMAKDAAVHVVAMECE